MRSAAHFGVRSSKRRKIHAALIRSIDTNRVLEQRMELGFAPTVREEIFCSFCRRKLIMGLRLPQLGDAAICWNSLRIYEPLTFPLSNPV